MKLADALSTRKEINLRLASAVPITANGMPTQEVKVVIPTGQGVDTEVAKLKYTSARTLIAKYAYYAEALRQLDLAISKANHEFMAQVPQYVFKDGYEGTPSNSYFMLPLTALLLRRKQLKGLVTLLTSYHDGARKAVSTNRKPTTVEISRYRDTPSAPAQQSDEWVITANSFDVTELATQLSFYSDCLREVDSAIQAVNWSKEVEVPAWIKTVYIPTGIPVDSGRPMLASSQ